MSPTLRPNRHQPIRKVCAFSTYFEACLSVGIRWEEVQLVATLPFVGGTLQFHCFKIVRLGEIS